MKKKSPCQDCLDRTITCHTVCRRYQEWKKEHEAEVLDEHRKRQHAYNRPDNPQQRRRLHRWLKMERKYK